MPCCVLLFIQLLSDNEHDIVYELFYNHWCTPNTFLMSSVSNMKMPNQDLGPLDLKFPLVFKLPVVLICLIRSNIFISKKIWLHLFVNCLFVSILGTFFPYTVMMSRFSEGM